MKVNILEALLGLFVFLGLIVSDVHGARMAVRLPNGLCIEKKVVSLREARYKNIVPQKFDLSCGAASLATILNYYFNDRTKEIDIIRYMLKHGDKEKIAKKGFSLLDLKRYSEHKSYMAAGYKRIPVEKLRKLKLPCIVLLNLKKYTHFVVLKGIRRDKAYIADPSFGNRRVNLEDFTRDWNGVIFLVVSRTKRPSSPFAFEPTIPAPEMDVMRIQQLGAGVGGFSFLSSPGEF